MERVWQAGGRCGNVCGKGSSWRSLLHSPPRPPGPHALDSCWEGRPCCPGPHGPLSPGVQLSFPFLGLGQGTCRLGFPGRCSPVTVSLTPTVARALARHPVACQSLSHSFSKPFRTALTFEKSAWRRVSVQGSGPSPGAGRPQRLDARLGCTANLGAAS